MKFRMTRLGRETPDRMDDGGGAISSRVDKKRMTVVARIMVGLFFSVFLVVGIAATRALVVKPWAGVWKARSWEPVACTIISSEVTTNRGSDSTTYGVAITYAYEVGGRRYEGSRYDFTTGTSSGRGAKKEIVARHRPGTQTTCYVNPENPAEAVIERSQVRDWGFGLIPLVFVAVGVGGVVFAIRGPRERDETGRVLSAGGAGGNVFTAKAAGEAVHAEDLLDEQSAGGGPVELKPAHTRGAVLGGLMFFALFWNGIVSVFVVNVVRDAMRGGAIIWVFALFLVPFVGVGLFLIGLVVRQAMEMANPVPRLTVNRRSVAPGGVLEVSWRFEGRASRLKDVRVWLEGREEATYRRGTNTRTDKAVFAELEIVSVAGLGASEPGRAALRLPERTMHSFKSANNRIAWALRVRGGIARWPDVSEEFPIAVVASGVKTRGQGEAEDGSAPSSGLLSSGGAA